MASRQSIDSGVNSFKLLLLLQFIYIYICNVGVILNHPVGNGLYQLSMVIWFSMFPWKMTHQQSIWVNYHDFTATEPWELLGNKGNHPFYGLNSG